MDAPTDLLEHILKSPIDAIITIENGGRIVFFNPGAEQIFGYMREEAEGKSLDLLIPGRFLAKHREHVRAFGASRSNAREMGARQDVYGRRKNGEEFRANASIYRHGSDGDQAFTVVLRDVGAHPWFGDTAHRLRLAVAAAGIGFFEHDHESGVVSFSPTLRELFGVAEATLDFERFLALIDAADRPDLVEAIHRAHNPSNGGAMVADHRIVRPDGVRRWVTVASQTHFTDDGAHRRPRATVGIVRDITDRKQAQERQEILLKLAEVLRSTPRVDQLQRAVATLLGEHLDVDCVHFAEHHADHVLVPPDFCRHGRKSLVGRHALADFGEVPQQLRSGRSLIVTDAQAAPTLSKRARDTYRMLEIGAFISVPLIHHGTLEWSLTVISTALRAWSADEASLIQDVGERTLAAIGRSRTEAALRESEQLYRGTLQALPAHIAVIDGDGRIIAVNQAWAEFAADNGAAKNPLVREGANYLDVCRAAVGKDEDAAKALAGVGDVLGGVRPAFTMEYACHSPQEERWFVMTVVPLDRGGRRGAVVAHSDITERKRAEAVLTNANEELEGRVAERTAALRTEMKRREETQAALAESQRLEAIGKLTGGVAHDANNMLTVISGNLEMLEDALGAAAPGLKYLREAQAAVERMTHLNRRLLTVARRRKLAPRVLDLNQQVAAMSDMLRRVLGETVTLTTTLHSDIWRVALDAGELDAALLNLAINARDAMPRGGRLHISTKNLEIDEEATRGEADLAPGKYVSISVTDSGDGIPPEVLPRVFEPFFTTKGQGKGTGLGLATVHGFTKQSGGHVTIYSELGRGTTVNIYFPRHDSEDAAASETQQSAKDVANGSGETVLVVEDDAQVRTITCARLERLGYRVLEAPDGPSALAFLRRGEHVDLVFSDIVMSGGMSGFELMTALDTHAPDLPVLLTSGFDLDAVRNGERQFSAKVLQKPYSQHDLAEAVKAALAGNA